MMRGIVNKHIMTVVAMMLTAAAMRRAVLRLGAAIVRPGTKRPAEVSAATMRVHQHESKTARVVDMRW
jgi:hypothetical protein